MKRTFHAFGAQQFAVGSHPLGMQHFHHNPKHLISVRCYLDILIISGTLLHEDKEEDLESLNMR